MLTEMMARVVDQCRPSEIHKFNLQIIYEQIEIIIPTEIIPIFGGTYGNRRGQG